MIFCEIEKILGSYIQPINEMNSAIDGEFDGWEEDDKGFLKITPIKMTEEEYSNLPEFQGY